MSRAKPFELSKHAVLDAWRQVKANRGAHGVDEQRYFKQSPTTPTTEFDLIIATYVNSQLMSSFISNDHQAMDALKARTWTPTVRH